MVWLKILEYFDLKKDLNILTWKKTWIFWERNITFLRNKEILNLCLRWHIFRSYRFVAEVIFNKKVIIIVTVLTKFWLFFRMKYNIEEAGGRLLLFSFNFLSKKNIFLFFLHVTASFVGSFDFFTCNSKFWS